MEIRQDSRHAETRPDRRLVRRGPRLPARGGAAPATLGEMVKRVGDDFSNLARAHLELARVELGGGVRRATADAAAILLGGVVALFGLAMLCGSAVAAAEPILPLWLRLVLGALLYMGLGGFMVYAFVRRLRGAPPRLDRSRREVRRTVKVLKEQVQDG